MLNSDGRMKQVSSGPISGVLKTRYKVASTHLGEVYLPTRGLDIYIDFNTFIHSLAKYRKYQNYLPFAGSEVEIDLMSSILSTLNHWKNFAKKWDNVRIIGFWNSFEMSERLAERKQLKSYLVPYENCFRGDIYKQFVYYVNQAIERVQTILKYVPNMYLITCSEFDSFVLPNVLDDYEHTNKKRIIITGTPLLTNYHYTLNTRVIYGQYKGQLIHHLADPIMIVQSVTKVNEDIISEFAKNKVFYNLLSTIVGDFDRGIIGLTQLGITSVAYNLLRAVEHGKVPENPKSVESVLPAIDKCFHDYILKSYPLVDIDSHTAMVPQSMIANIKSSMIDLVDIDGLRALSIDGLNLLELL